MRSIAFLTLLLAVRMTGLVWAQEELLSSARNERGLVIYGSPNLDDLNFLAAAFTKKYSFARPEVYRATSAAIYNKVITEARGGRRAFDVMINSGFETHLLKKGNFFAPYFPKEINLYAQGFKEPAGYWTTFFTNTHVISYNVRQVKPEEVPRTYEDLLHRRWKGRLMMHSEDYEWFTNQLLIRGEEKGLKLMRALAQQEITFRRGHTLISQLVAAGEGAASINSYAYRSERIKRHGGPIAWVAVEPVVANLLCISVAREAPNPNTARLFVDFATSKEGQTIVSQRFQRVPAHMDVEANPPSLTRGIDFWPSNPELGERIDHYGKLFREVFRVN
jgi:iron(III) transport system substrate-binding protein